MVTGRTPRQRGKPTRGARGKPPGAVREGGRRSAGDEAFGGLGQECLDVGSGWSRCPGGSGRSQGLSSGTAVPIVRTSLSSSPRAGPYRPGPLRHRLLDLVVERVEVGESRSPGPPTGPRRGCGRSSEVARVRLGGRPGWTAGAWSCARDRRLLDGLALDRRRRAAADRLGATGRAAADLRPHPVELVLDVGGRRELLELEGDVVLLVPVGSSNAPLASSSSIAPARACSWGRLVLGPLDREADVAHLLADAGEGLPDPGLRLGRGVRRLDRLLLGAEGVDLGLQPLAGPDELLLLALQLCVLRLEVGELLLDPERRVSASRARSSRPTSSAFCACWVSLSAWVLSPFAWSSIRLRLVATSATPRRTFCRSSSWRW